jgi:hypothetical protein
MQKLFKVRILLLTALVVCSNCLSANAQYYKPEGLKGPIGEPFEVTGGFDASKQKSNDSNYNSSYKPSDWWLEGMKWGQSISDVFSPFFTPIRQNSSPGPEPGNSSVFQNSSNEYALANSGPEAQPNHYFSYGIGLGIG